jgi:hypothetical protein
MAEPGSVTVPIVIEQDEGGAWCAHAQLRQGLGAHGQGESEEAAVHAVGPGSHQWSSATEHQPVPSGNVDLSDEQLDRLLSCMGYRLEVVRRPVLPDLTRSERRSWRLHRQLSTQLTRSVLPEWRPQIASNLRRLREGVRGQPHLRHLDRWEHLVERGDLPGLHRALTGLDRESIEMREVSPMGGLLSQQERAEALAEAS